MELKDWFDCIQKGFPCAGIIACGVWAYFKFLCQREMLQA